MMRALLAKDQSACWLVAPACLVLYNKLNWVLHCLQGGNKAANRSLPADVSCRLCIFEWQTRPCCWLQG